VSCLVGRLAKLFREGAVLYYSIVHALPEAFFGELPQKRRQLSRTIELVHALPEGFLGIATEK
jgi:hypothetical protein